MMKKIILLLLLSALSLNMQAQVQTNNPDNVIENQDSVVTDMENVVKPEYPGGIPELVKFLSQTVKYPREAEQLGAQGRVLMGFIVEKDGSVSNITAEECHVTDISPQKMQNLTQVEQQVVKERVAKLFAKEGARVVKEMKGWQPGYVMDEATGKKKLLRVKYRLPISFKLR